MKNFFFIFISTLLLIIFLEVLARLYIGYAYDQSNAGIQERSVNLIYKPFVMWGPDFDKLADNFVKQKKIDEDDLVILILGGSTAEQFNDPSKGLGILDATFKNFFVDRKIHIFNAASGGYNIRQEIVAMMLTVEKIKPDLILIIDGANDIQHSIRAGVVPGTTYLDTTYKLILNKPYLGPLIYAIQQSQLINALLRASSRSQIRNFDIENITKINQTLEYYFDSRKFINNYAKGAGIKTVFMLQPHVTFSSHPDDNEAKKRYEYRASVVRSAFEKISSSQASSNLCFIDSNQIIEDKNPFLEFSDDVHFKSTIGYKFIADNLLSKYLLCYQQENHS